MKLIKLIVISILVSSCASTTINRQYEELKVDELKHPINDEFSDPEAFSNFSKEICGSKIKKEECVNKYGLMIWNRLKAYYNYADENVVYETCQAYPIECKQPLFIEATFIKSHNSTVENMKSRAIAQKRGQSQKAWAAFGKSMQQSNEQMQRQQQHDQLIQQLNKPIQTDCFRDISGNIKCTSY